MKMKDKEKCVIEIMFFILNATDFNSINLIYIDVREGEGIRR